MTFSNDTSMAMKATYISAAGSPPMPSAMRSGQNGHFGREGLDPASVVVAGTNDTADTAVDLC